MTTKPEVETKSVTVGFSHPASDSPRVLSTIENSARRGWQYAGRKSSEGLFSIGASTTLMFRRPKFMLGKRTKQIKFDTKVISSGYCHPSHTSDSMRTTIKEMAPQGWIYAGRTNHEGFFGFIGCKTCLIFMKPKVHPPRTAASPRRLTHAAHPVRREPFLIRLLLFPFRLIRTVLLLLVEIVSFTFAILFTLIRFALRLLLFALIAACVLAVLMLIVPLLPPDSPIVTTLAPLLTFAETWLQSHVVEY